MMDGNQRTMIHRGAVFELGIEEVRLPNGHTFLLEVVRHPGGAAVVALNEQRQVCLVHQYRHVAQGMLYELPAGKCTPGEPALVTAQRELSEEAGLEAHAWQALGTLWTSPGVFSEQIHLYLAQQLQAVPAALEAEEYIEVLWVDIGQALAWAADGTISDAKTIAGLLRASAVLERSPVAQATEVEPA